MGESFNIDRGDRILQAWRFTDGKSGHEKQTEGFLKSISEHFEVVETRFHIQPRGGVRRLWNWISGQFPDGRNLQAPDLLLGAGHRVHFPMLAARRVMGGRTLVFMKPTLPLNLFDLSLIPQHDNPPDSERVLPTCGALTSIKPSTDRNLQAGLFLIGGPSTHFDWSDEGIVGQVGKVIMESDRGNVRWKLTTSRRTPNAFLECLQASGFPRMTVFPVEETGPDWVEDQLSRSGVVWVTEDSVSMVYEALTAGSLTGLLQVPVKAEASRVSRGVRELIKKEWLTPFENWDRGESLRSAPDGFDEAARCAEHVVRRWFQ